MNRQSVESREIAIVGYDEKTRTLEVTFRRGGVYHYFQVPQETYQALMAASSLGTYFAQEIQDKFSYQKIS